MLSTTHSSNNVLIIIVTHAPDAFLEKVIRVLDACWHVLLSFQRRMFRIPHPLLSLSLCPFPCKRRDTNGYYPFCVPSLEGIKAFLIPSRDTSLYPLLSPLLCPFPVSLQGIPACIPVSLRTLFFLFSLAPYPYNCPP